MKKILLYTLMLLGTMALYNCSDDETVGEQNRQFMTMFRTTDNTGLNSSDMEPYYCHHIDNTQYLYWYKVNGCYGYEIKWFYRSTVQHGTAAVWDQAQLDGYMKGDTVIANPDQIELVIKNLEYSQTYSYAIRVLNSADKNDPKNSPWYGYGTQQNWQDYYQETLDNRYECPRVVAYIEMFEETEPNYKTSFKVHINKSATMKVEWDEDHLVETTTPYTQDELEVYNEHFAKVNGDQEWKVDYFTIVPSDETVKANIPFNAEGKYVPTQEEWDQGWFLVEGLSENTLYTVAAWDADIPVKVDASYKNVMERTKGDPADPILIKHVPTPVDTINGTPYDISQWNAMKLDNIIADYMKSSEQAEGQVFYLEGGKAYFFSTNLEMIKGFSLETDPTDLKQGKRATVYLGGIAYDGDSHNFITGNDSKKYSDPTVQLKMSSITFRGIDFDCPRAKKFDAAGSGTGNYFINMYGSNIGFRLNKLEIDDCSFQNFVRGFYRVQGSYNFNISNFIINNCVFYNCGPYGNNAGYNWIHFELKNRGRSNLLNNCQITNNVFYNNAHGALISDKNTSVTWEPTVRWNVKISNNSFINFGNNRSDSYIIGYTGQIPGGSVFEVTNNLIVLTKNEADVNRPMNCSGWRCNTINGGNGLGTCTFIIGNNWSTNDNLSNGQVLNAYAFSGTSNCPGKWQQSNPEWFPKGVEELVIHADNISATELMKNPNPPHLMGTGPAKTDYECDNIDGVYYNLNNPKTQASEIFKRKIGAPRLRGE